MSMFQSSTRIQLILTGSSRHMCWLRVFEVRVVIYWATSHQLLPLDDLNEKKLFQVQCNFYQVSFDVFIRIHPRTPGNTTSSLTRGRAILISSPRRAAVGLGGVCAYKMQITQPVRYSQGVRLVLGTAPGLQNLTLRR